MLLQQRIHTTIEELLYASFSVWSTYQRIVDDYFFPELLVYLAGVVDFPILKMFSSFSFNSLVSIVTGYGLDGRGLIPGRCRRFFHTPQCSGPALGPTQPPIQWVPGVKWQGHEAA
jgi:hypothetical protein